jgi:hypothetical protein
MRRSRKPFRAVRSDEGSNPSPSAQQSEAPRRLAACKRSGFLDHRPCPRKSTGIQGTRLAYVFTGEQLANECGSRVVCCVNSRRRARFEVARSRPMSWKSHGGRDGRAMEGDRLRSVEDRPQPVVLKGGASSPSSCSSSSSSSCWPSWAFSAADASSNTAMDLALGAHRRKGPQRIAERSTGMTRTDQGPICVRSRLFADCSYFGATSEKGETV